MEFRVKAFLLHFAISASILALLAVIAATVWYPYPYFLSEGPWGAGRILLAVDLILGPLLTLSVARRGKPGLKFDLSVIAAVQVAALLYGTYILYIERPAVLVFNGEYFVTVQWSRIDLNVAPPEVRVPSKAPGPRWVASLLPEDRIERRRMLKEFMEGGRPPRELDPGNYSPLEEHWDKVLAAAEPLEAVLDTPMGRNIDLSELPNNGAGLMALPFIGPVSSGYAFLDPHAPLQMRVAITGSTR